MNGILILIFFLFLRPGPAEFKEYHRVPARTGDTPVTLLERYGLDQYDCNYDQFYKLNKMKEASTLREGARYFIPVMIYAYDGKSIRSTLELDDWDQAVRIKEYNEQMLRNRLRRKSIVDSRILWVPFHELNCAEAELKVYNSVNKIVPSNIKGTRKFPIFGPEHQEVPIESNRLRGKVYYIVAGHGGPDPGAIGRTGSQSLCEDEYAYDVCLRLVRNLLRHGATAYMVIRDPNDGLRSGKFLPCDEDEYCWGDLKIPESQRERLLQRSDVVNELYEKNRSQGVKEQYLITIHLDSRSKKERVDVFFYYNPSIEGSKNFANNLQRALAEKYKKYRKYGRYTGSVSARDLHMLREVKPVPVFIELGNIVNAGDQQRFILEKNRQYLADWLFEGIL